MVKTILIIDDEKSIRKSLSMILVQEGYNVETAEGIEEARSSVNNADLVLLDIRLRDGNRIEFLEELRNEGFDKPTILMSGIINFPEIEKAIELTGNPVIQKPIPFKELISISAIIISE